MVGTRKALVFSVSVVLVCALSSPVVGAAGERYCGCGD